ncbi:alpha/beta hydrolase family protein [Halorubrum ezzemoulense]|uniref:alpha/beta hydrolase family protein n=1 Tax=Halorubrum ezzemoulense TaxID=337243 RepID=UPI003CCD2A0C
MVETEAVEGGRTAVRLHEERDGVRLGGRRGRVDHRVDPGPVGVVGERLRGRKPVRQPRRRRRRASLAGRRVDRSRRLGRRLPDRQHAVAVPPRCAVDRVAGREGGRVGGRVGVGARPGAGVRERAVDGDRVGIFGGSGGGLMTVNALGNSDRFRAGAAFYGVYDYESFVDDTDDVGWQLLKRELGDFVADLDAYRDASPIRTVPDIDDPLMVLHGEEDARVPISQSEQLVAELEKHDARHELRRYEGEPHGFGELDHVLDAYTRVADLFAKYLRRLPDDGSSRSYEPPE